MKMKKKELKYWPPIISPEKYLKFICWL